MLLPLIAVTPGEVVAGLGPSIGDGVSTIDHSVPFQWAARVLVSLRLPTTQASVGEVVMAVASWKPVEVGEGEGRPGGAVEVSEQQGDAAAVAAELLSHGP